VLRASPCAGHPLLSGFDVVLGRALSTVINVEFSDDQWMQASRPVRMGGLGVRSVILLAPSAFLALAAGSLELQERLLSGCCDCFADTEVDRILKLWVTVGGNAYPQAAAAVRQSCWDSLVCKAQFDQFMSMQVGISDTARLLAVSAPHSGDWLHALPISACGLRLDDNAIRVTVGLRLGARLCEPHRCPCGTLADVRGLHGLACKPLAVRTSRHNYINDVDWRAVVKAGVPASKEPPGLSRSDGKRPDGVTQIPWESGKCAAWDVTVTDTLAASNLSLSSVAAGSATE